MQLTGHELVLLLSGTGVSGIAVAIATQLLKKLGKLQQKEVIHLLVVTLSAVLAVGQYLQQIHSSLPPYVLGISGTSIYGFSQLAYRYAGVANDFVGKVRTKSGDTTVATSETPTAATPAAF